MTVTLVVAWVGLVTIVGVNAAAAGVTALLHRRQSVRRGTRALLGSAFAGFLPASALLGLTILGSSGTDSPGESWMFPVVFGVSFAVATLVALPGALIVARKLEAPGDDYRTFE